MNLFALQKIKQKTNTHTNYKINPLKDIHSKYFYLIEKLNNLSLNYFFIIKFIVTFAHPFKKAC